MSVKLSMLQLLLRHLDHIYLLNSIKDKFSTERDAKLTDVIEVRVFIDLLYLSGADKGNRHSLKELWGKENRGMEKFGLVMSLRRFKLLLK